MNKQQAIAIVKAINRRERVRAREDYCPGDITFGWDYTTWNMVHPQLSALYSKCAEIITGKQGRYIPRCR